MGAKTQLVGEKFGRLTVLSESGRDKNGRVLWLCKCDCGNFGKWNSNVLKRNTKSCGCLKIETTSSIMKTHGATLGANTPELNTWYHMRSRCLSEANPDFHRYGGRGIKICDRWLNAFANFLEDMGKKPSAKHTLDRIDNDGNYEPSNCRWVTQAIQTRNRGSFHVFLNYKGEKVMMSDVARDLNMTPENLRSQLRNRSLEYIINRKHNAQ